MRRRTRKYLLGISLFLILLLGIGLYAKNLEKNHIKELTMEEKLEDFEYLYNFISVNYPYLKVNERVNGVDWMGKKSEFRKSIEAAKTDATFEGEISRIVSELNNLHTEVIGKTSLFYMYSAFSDPEYRDAFKPWLDVISDEKVLKKI